MNVENEKPILEVQHLSFSYSANDQILKNISFKINAGESLGILGPNGGGKSTLMKLLIGLLDKDSGSIKIINKEVKYNDPEIYSLLSYVPQHSELNATFPIRVSEYLDYARAAYPKEKRNLNTNDELLTLVGVLHKKNELLLELSGGEKQRVLLARAMICKPKILLLDEPTKGLDSNGQDQLLLIIENIKKVDKTAVVIIDHNINQIIKNCHKILCLNRTLHWHDHKDLLTKDIIENVYHCEFEHLLIHEKDLSLNENPTHDHQYCQHDHQEDASIVTKHKFVKKIQKQES